MKYTAGLLSLAAAASAQQTLYGQCGGSGWTGPTTCVSGSYCQYYNDWYSQCIAGTATSTTTTTTSKTTTKSSSTTTTTTKTTTTTTTTKTSSSTTKSTTTTTKSSTTTSKTTTSGSSPTGFAKTDGTHFNIDGVTKYYPGTNCYWIGMLTYDPYVDQSISDMASSGLKILRVWGFNDVTTIPADGTVYFQYLQAGNSSINTGEYGLQRLDYVVQVAAQYDMKLIINFVNNWSDYGGIPAYVTAFGGTATSWYTNTEAQAQYQEYIAAVVSRYKNSSTVFAWELCNEPRCNGCDTSVIYNWAKTTSAYIKSLDPYHMVTMGDEGFGLTTGDGSYPYTYDEGVDWASNLNITTLDFATFHLYPGSWGESNDWGNEWITTHGAACEAAGKPCLLEEYGSPAPHCTTEQPWQQTSLNTTGMAGDLFWQFGDELPGWTTSDDGNTIFFNTSDWTCLVTDHVAAINAS